MTAKQKEMLVESISQWSGIIDNAYVQPKMQEIYMGLDDTYFARSGRSHTPQVKMVALITVYKDRMF